MQKLLLTFLSISLFYYSNAQTEIDALRYSKLDVVGTARFSAMAGAYGALGADFTALSCNPAGIGFYQFSELIFTPAIGNVISTSYFSEERNKDDKFHSNFSNFGYVISSPLKNGSEWKRLNFAIGYNRMANYKKRLYINGKNKNTSMIDNFVASAQGKTIDNLHSFSELLAWNTYLFDPVDTIDNGNYISNLNSSASKNQKKVINSNGSSREYIFSAGTSYEDKIYLGATIGMPRIDYYEEATFTESEFVDTAAHLESFTYDEEYTTTGKGINIKVGVIARLNDWIRLGGAFHSPTYYYYMKDEYNTAITSIWNDTLGTISKSSPFGYFEYELTTPYKTIGSIAINIKKQGQVLVQGLITANIEMIDYSSAKFNSNTYKFTDENNEINSTYTKATNIRLGAEMKYKPFRIRGGYALYGSPYKDNTELKKTNYTFGLGLDKGSFIIDFAYILSEENGEHFMYSDNLVDPATIITTSHNFLLTLGFRY